MSKYKQHHMSRKRLKANKMVEAAINLRHFLVNNKQKIYTGLLVVALLLVLIIAKSASDASLNEKASEKLNKTLLLLRSSDNKENINLVMGNLERIMNEFSGTSHAGRAAYNLGTIQYNVQGYLKAVQSFQTAVADGKGHIVPSALLAIGDAYNQLNNPKKALEFYSRIIDKNYDGFVGAARVKKVYTLIALKKFKEATAAIDELEKSSDSAFIREVAKLRVMVKYYGKQTGSTR